MLTKKQKRKLAIVALVAVFALVLGAVAPLLLAAMGAV